MTINETTNSANKKLAMRSNEFTAVVSACECSTAAGQVIELETGLEKVKQIFQLARNDRNNIYIIGNGGSAAVASHAITDFMNVCKLSAHVLHESSLMTCMANDFGYENAYARMLEASVRSGDILIAISSSGRSKNIINAAKKASQMGCLVITLTGFEAGNDLRKVGDLNFWLNSHDYDLVEIGHLFILHNISDRFMTK